MDVVRKPRWITAIGCLRYSDLFASGTCPLPYDSVPLFHSSNPKFSSSNFVLLCTGSWDGEIRLWKLDSSLKSFTPLGSIPALGVVNSLQLLACPRTATSSLTWVDSAPAPGTTNGVTVPESDAIAPVVAPSKSSNKAETGKVVLLVAGVGQESRLGRWVQQKGEGHLNGALVVALHPRTHVASSKS